MLGGIPAHLLEIYIRPLVKVFEMFPDFISEFVIMRQI